MALQGDEIAERIEAKIREAVNRMMAEVRTSIADVREAIEQQLDAALQSVQADVNALAFRAHLEDGLRELTEAYEARLQQAPPAGVTSEAVKQSVRAIESGKNQVEILSALLEEASKFGSRAALLILKGDSFAGWKGVGFSTHGGSDEMVKRFTAAAGSLPQFDQMLREERTVLWDGQNLATRFGVGASARAALIPMVIKDKVAAAVFVDAVTSDIGKFDQSAIELLVFNTGLLIDTLAIRKKVPSPTLSAITHTLASARAEAQPSMSESQATETIAVRGMAIEQKADDTAPGAAAIVATPEAAPPPQEELEVEDQAEQESQQIESPSESEEEPRPEWHPIPEVESPQTAAPAADFEAAPPPSRSFELQTEPPAERSWPRPPEVEEPEVEKSFNTAMFPMMKPPPPPLEGTPVAPPTLGPTPVAELAERASTQYIPPPGLTRGGLFGAKPDEDRRHEEARRFARLLVSEIKLYNESQVEQGRRDRDLYERLKEDIDRSRQMYDERVPDDVRKGTNYFFDELVRILADGNRDALGL